MNRDTATVNLTIDNKPLTARVGVSILDVANEHGIYIPTLCYHKQLSPHGGCRMCIVEVEGLRHFPTACTTPVSEGMHIRTHTAQIQEMRAEILQLFLSEHTSSCLVCDERKDCREFMSTVRKAGVTTGCRYCPKDGQCELQAVTESLEVDDIIYPIYYRGMPVETEDPFYDRDYNLCILCGRCVRMCQEVRLANVLAYKYQGRKSIIGPAFSRTHLEAGCEFCGACVSVCPTGTLREKARAWEGKPEREETTTCSFCGVGCQVQVLVKEDRVIGTLPADDAVINRGQLCVKGRFCNTELVNGHQRVRHPYRREGSISWDVSWEESFSLIAEKLGQSASEGIGMLVSANLSNEDLYIAQKFSRVVLHSHNIDSSTRLFYGSGFNAYLRLMERSVPLSALDEATSVFMIGLDTRYSRSVVGVAVRRAMERGIPLFTMHTEDHTFSLGSDVWLRPESGEEGRYLDALLRLVTGELDLGETLSGNEAQQLRQVAAALSVDEKPVILFGTDLLRKVTSDYLVTAVAEIANVIGAGILALPAQNNLRGTLVTGTYPELLPGMFPVSDAEQIRKLEAAWGVSLNDLTDSWNAVHLVTGETPLAVLYAVGDVPPGQAPPATFTVFQNMYPPEPYCGADLVLPSAAATEIDGSFVNGAGRIQPVRRAVPPPGIALPDWEILCRLARSMGASGFEFTSPGEIREEMETVIGAFSERASDDRTPLPTFLPPVMRNVAGNGERSPAGEPRALSAYRAGVEEHTHRGFPLSAWVEGARMIFPSTQHDAVRDAHV